MNNTPRLRRKTRLVWQQGGRQRRSAGFPKGPLPPGLSPVIRLLSFLLPSYLSCPPPPGPGALISSHVRIALSGYQGSQTNIQQAHEQHCLSLFRSLKSPLYYLSMCQAIERLLETRKPTNVTTVQQELIYSNNCQDV